ncbi:MAG: NADAR family protein [Clostridia bacterium]|nr:NADAR family protein [Clostridia bacterium]
MIVSDNYRDIWLAEKVEEFIGFYNREFFCLDNFSSFGFVYGGKYYQTVEHGYQSLKFKGKAPEIEEKIIKCYSAYEAQKIAHENIDKQVDNWDEIKVGVMEELLRAKLDQHPYVKQKLLQTENYLICEDSPKDSFWGIGRDRNGRNELGKLWMKLRKELVS